MKWCRPIASAAGNCTGWTWLIFWLGPDFTPRGPQTRNKLSPHRRPLVNPWSGHGVESLILPCRALVGTLAALTALLALRAFPAFFAGGLVITAVVGLAFQVGPAGLVPAVCVFALPLLLTGLTRRIMELPCRNDAPKSTRPHLPPRR